MLATGLGYDMKIIPTCVSSYNRQSHYLLPSPHLDSHEQAIRFQTFRQRHARLGNLTTPCLSDLGAVSFEDICAMWTSNNVVADDALCGLIPKLAEDHEQIDGKPANVIEKEHDRLVKLAPTSETNDCDRWAVI
jgi:hypothetical protein